MKDEEWAEGDGEWEYEEAGRDIDEGDRGYKAKDWEIQKTPTQHVYQNQHDSRAAWQRGQKVHL